MNVQGAGNETIITNDANLLVINYDTRKSESGDSSIISLHEYAPDTDGEKSQEIIEISDDSLELYSNSVTPQDNVPKEHTKSNILKGVNAIVEVYSGLENRFRCISRQLEKLGANVHHTITKEVTHLVFKHGRSKIFHKARERNIKIVSVLWVERCKVEMVRVPEEHFPVQECMPRMMEKKLRSMYPKDFNEQFSKSDKKIKNILSDADGQNTETPIQIKSIKRNLFTDKDRAPHVIASAKFSCNGEFPRDFSTNSASKTSYDLCKSNKTQKLNSYESHQYISTNKMENEPNMSKSCCSEPTKRLHTLNILRRRNPTINISSSASKSEKMPQSSSTLFKDVDLKENSIDANCESWQDSVRNVHTSLAKSQSTLKTILENVASENFDGNCGFVSGSSKISSNGKSKNIVKNMEMVDIVDLPNFRGDSQVLKQNKIDDLFKKLQGDSTHMNNCPIYERSQGQKEKRCDCKYHEHPCKRRKANEIILSSSKTVSQDNVDSLTKSLEALSPSQNPVCNQNAGNTPKFDRKVEIDSLTQRFQNLSPPDKSSTSNYSRSISSDAEKGMEVQTLTQRLNELSSNKNMSLLKEIKEVPRFKRRADIEFYEKLVANSKNLAEANISGISLILPDDLMNDCDPAVPEQAKQKLSVEKINHETGDTAADHPNAKNTKGGMGDSVEEIDLKRLDLTSLDTPNQKLNNILKPRESVFEFKKIHHLQQHSSKKYIKHCDRRNGIAILESNMRSKDSKILLEAINKLGGVIVRGKNIKRLTHVVCGDDVVSYYVVKGIIAGCWIISFQWVKKSILENKWIEEEQFELDQPFPAAKISRLNKQNCYGFYAPDIFSSLGPIFIGTHSSKLTNELQNIVLKCQGLVTGGYKNAKVSVGRYFKEIPCVNVSWILDSVAQHKPVPFSDYSLSLSL